MDGVEAVGETILSAAELFRRSDDVEIKQVTEVKAFASGIWGFQVWTLQGFDENGNLIAEEKEDFGSLGNKKKLQAFVAKLKEKGYILKTDQVQDLSSKLSISYLDMFEALGDAVGMVQDKMYQVIYKSNSKIVSKTCPELNNVTFTNAPPFNVLGLPQCWDDIEPKLVLYLNDADKTECSLDLRNLPNAKSNYCYQLIKNNGISKLVLAVHGYMNSLDTEWLQELKDAILETEPNIAVMVLGWGQLITEALSYPQAAANTRYFLEFYQ